MIMPEEKAELTHGTQVNYWIASFGCYTPVLLPDGAIEVLLTLETDEEHEFTLHPGDTFPVRDQTWKLDRVENAEDRANWRVHIVRVS
jgi:Family of unknown function (DUF6406)